MYYRLLHLISLSPCRHVGHLLSLCPRHFSPFDLVGDGRPASKEEEEVPSTRGKLLTLLLLLFHWEMDDNFSYFCLVPYTLSIRPVRRRRRRGSSPSFYRQSASRGIDLCPTIYYTERERERETSVSAAARETCSFPSPVTPPTDRPHLLFRGGCYFPSFPF